MASSQPSSTNAMRGDAQSLSLVVRSLKVRDLSNICSQSGLPKAGVKADLQNRILELINRAANRGDLRAFEAVKKTVHSVAYGDNYPNRQPAAPYYSGSPVQSASSTYSSNAMGSYSQNGYGYGGSNGRGAHPGANQPAFHFKSSPFYDVESTLGDVKPCEVMSQHRNSVPISIKVATYPALQRCLNDSTLRVMVFCAAGNSGVQDIAFPHNCEIKLNGGEVKANLRGLKGKPGSTKPVDITDLLRLKPSTYNNNLDFIYALTSKGGDSASRNSHQKFYLVMNLCKSHPVSTLVDKIDRRNRISKASVIQELTQKAKDPDIVATSQVLSLKCPLSYMRLGLPVRSMSCKHIQCFDATSYLQLQEQGPQWLCPVCNQPAPFENLAVDEYVKDILAKTSKSQDQVTIEPDGQWHAPGVIQEESQPEDHGSSYVDDDDDALIISDVSFIGGRGLNTPNRSAQTIGTPNTGASREGSSLPKAASSNKRPIAQVIDLTLSDDDEPAAPPAKRQNLGPNGYSNSFGR